MNKLKTASVIIVSIIVFSFIYTKSTNPKLNLASLTGKELTENNTNRNEILFIYFSLGCGECENLIKDVIKKKETLNRKFKIIFVSNEKDVPKINDFFRNNSIKIDLSNVYIDKNETFEDFINLDFVVNFPTICIYNVEKDTKKIIYRIDDLN